MFFSPTIIKSVFHTILVLVLGLASTLWSQNLPTTVFIFPTVIDTTSEDSLTEICSSILEQISNEFASQDTFNVIPLDSIADLTDMQISDYENDTLRQQFCAELHSKWGVEVGVYSTIRKSYDRISILIRAIELPSEILIHHGIVDLAADDSTMLTLASNIEPLLADLRHSLLAKKTAWGYPFAVDECGILVINNWKFLDDSVAGNLALMDSLLLQLRTQRDSLNIEQLRFKILGANEEGWQSDSTADWQHIRNPAQQLNACLTFWGEPDSVSKSLSMAFNSKVFAESLQVTTIPPFFPSFPELTTTNFAECKELAMETALELSLGSILWQTARFDDAEPYFLHVDSIATAGGCRLAIANFIASQYHHSKANSRAALGKIDEEALASADRQYSACLTELPSDSGLAAAWLNFNWADVRQRQGAWVDAQAGFEKAKHLFGQNGHNREAALMDMKLADVYTNQKQWDKVFITCEAALPTFTAMGDCVAVSAALEKLAPIYELRNEPDKSLIVYNRNANLNIELGRDYEAARIYGHIGQLLRDQGDFDAASGFLKQELDIAVRLQSEPALARSHFHLGTLYHVMDSTAAAITHFEEAYQTMDMLGDTLGMARAMNNIGAAYHRSGQLQEALTSYQAALDLSEKFGDADNQIRSQSNIADLFIDQEEWDEAYQHYDQAIALAESNGDMRRAAIVIYSKGLAFIKQGRLRAGYEGIKKAIEMGGGTVHGDPDKEKEFLRRLEKLIDEIEGMSR